MFNWLFSNPRVSGMARAIHEMSCIALHSRDTLGTPLHRHFSSYPMLKKQYAPTPSDYDQIHTIWLHDGRQGFQILCCDDPGIDRSWLSVSPDGDFLGASIQSSTKAQYLVRSDSPISRPEGRLARMLLREFISRYEAMDLTV